MAWVYLVAAGILEIVWAYALKQSLGFTRIGPAAVSILAMVASVVLLSLAMRTLPLGTAYVIWTGMGAIGAFAIGVAVFGESANLIRLTSATLIVVGLILMKLSASA